MDQSKRNATIEAPGKQDVEGAEGAERAERAEREKVGQEPTFEWLEIVGEFTGDLSDGPTPAWGRPLRHAEGGLESGTVCGELQALIGSTVGRWV